MVARRAVKSASADGRSRRWEEHRATRRQGLIAAAVAAIRAEGPQAGLDEIAREAGISKTVLYRHFADKADLVDAVMAHVSAEILLPRLQRELVTQRPDHERIRAVIAAYVQVLVDEPELYAFVIANSGQARSGDFVANTERVVAQALATVLGDRLRSLEMDSGGALPWAYGLVGMVQLAAHWWVAERSMSAEALVDYLTMLVVGGFDGVLGAGGAPSRFTAGATPGQG